MRLLHAQLPLYTGNIQLAMNRACFLQHVTGTILRHIKEKKKMPFIDEPLSDEDQLLAEEVWTKRLAHVKCLLGNCLLSIKVIEEEINSIKFSFLFVGLFACS